MDKIISKTDSKAVEKLLVLMGKDELIITGIQTTSADGLTTTTGGVSFLNKSGLVATFMEYDRGYVTLQISAGSSSVSLTDISGLLILNPSYNTLYGRLSFSTVSVYAGASSGDNDDECLTIEGTATSSTGFDANFLGIDNLPLTDLRLSVSIKHKESRPEKNIRVIVIAKLTIEEKEVQVVLSLPIADRGLWNLKLIAPGLDFSLAKLAKLIMGSKVFEELPEQIKNIPSFNLVRLEISFDPKQKSLNDISFALQSVGEWNLMPGSGESSALALKDMGLDVTIYRDSSGSFNYDGHINATAHIGSFDITAFIPLPVTGVLSLYTNTTEPLDDLGVFSELLAGNDFSRFLSSGDFKNNFAMSVHNLGVELDLNGSKVTYFILNGEASLDLPIANFSLNLALNLLIERVAGDEKICYTIDAQASLLIDKIFLTLIGKHNNDIKGWLLTGNITPKQSITIDEIVSDLVTKFGINSSIPSSISSLTVNHVLASFNTATKEFIFTCESKLIINSKPIDIKVNINIIKQQDGFYNKHFDGHITIGNLKFALIFDIDKTSTRFLATCHEQQTVQIKDLISYIDPELKNEIPQGLETSLKDALFAYSKSSTLTNFLFGLNIGGEINLSNLRLVGREFPPNQTLKISLQVLVTKANFTATELQTFNTLYAEGGIKLPTIDLNKRLDLIPSIQLGSEIQQLELPITINKKSGQIEEKTPSRDNNSLPSVVTTSSSPTQMSDSIKWFKLQKSFGPVHFQKIGVKLQDQELWFLLDASLATAGLTVSLDGLAVSSPLTELKPKFHLNGIGIDYRSQTIEIGGAFLRKQVEQDGQTLDEYDGAAILRTQTKGKQLTLSALGSYTYYQGHPSLFIYALLDFPLGGPPCFFVTGLAAGFGYNRTLRLPEKVEDVAQFPLVKMATGDAGEITNITQVLETLSSYIPPATGELFFAVGIKFTSFKTIDSFALLTVQLGNRLEINVLGLSTLIAPPAETGVEPVAKAQLAFRATYLPDEGFLKVEAALLPGAYLFSGNCHLSGRFAFYSWFSGEHEGEFILTLGGYHPDFKVPEHYPKLPRLQLNWQVDDKTFIKGDAYFALCPHTLMAGGHLDVVYESGNLKAWLKTEADFLIAWKPYHYDAHLYVTIGASYTYEFFGIYHITAEVGADLHLWGPDFGGTATIHIWVVQINIDFGSTSSRQPQPISWDTFKASFLPDDKQVCSIAVKDGLVKSASSTSGENNHLGVINSKHFSLVTNSIVPSNQAKHAAQENHFIPFGIAPMDLKANSHFTSTHTITITRTENNIKKSVENEFKFTPILKNMPSGLWGNTFRPDLNAPQTIDNLLSGFEITPGNPPEPGHTHELPCDRLQDAPSTLSDAYHWNPLPRFAADLLEDKPRVDKIKQTLSDRPTRTTLLQALGFSADEIDLHASIADDFLVPPQIEMLTPCAI